MSDFEEQMIEEESFDPANGSKQHYENQSDVATLLGDTCWINFCFCYGAGCVHPTDPVILGQSKFLCLASSFTTTECCGDEGMCHSVEKLCCLTSFCACPPGGGSNDGMPLCAVCNQRCGGEEDGVAASTEAGRIAEETFMCYFCIFSGWGVSGCRDPCFFADQKFLCLKAEGHTEDACNETGCMHQYSKVCCCVEVFTCPPGGGIHDGVPTLACCGKVCMGDEDLV